MPRESFLRPRGHHVRGDWAHDSAGGLTDEHWLVLIADIACLAPSKWR